MLDDILIKKDNPSVRWFLNTDGNTDIKLLVYYIQPSFCLNIIFYFWRIFLISSEIIVISSFVLFLLKEILMVPFAYFSSNFIAFNT